jgi:opacity protein-like surface antigen
MKRSGLALLSVAMLCMVAVPVSAQGIRWGVGAGLVMPMGDYGEIDNMGFTGGIGGTYRLPGGQLGIRGDLSFTRSTHDGVDGNTQILGGMASLVYQLGGAVGARPYLMGGLGMYNVKADFGGGSGSETKVGFGIGGGVSLPMGTGGSRLFVETRYTSISANPSLTFLPFIVGISFGS